MEGYNSDFKMVMKLPAVKEPIILYSQEIVDESLEGFRWRLHLHGRKFKDQRNYYNFQDWHQEDPNGSSVGSRYWMSLFDESLDYSKIKGCQVLSNLQSEVCNKMYRYLHKCVNHAAGIEPKEDPPAIPSNPPSQQQAQSVP